MWVNANLLYALTPKLVHVRLPLNSIRESMVASSTVAVYIVLPSVASVPLGTKSATLLAKGAVDAAPYLFIFKVAFKISLSQFPSTGSGVSSLKLATAAILVTSGLTL